METSDSYLVTEKMIRLGEIMLSELEHLLDSLEAQQLINAKEHEDLLELAWKLSTDKPAPP